jgi:hypothetical protein
MDPQPPSEAEPTSTSTSTDDEESTQYCARGGKPYQALAIRGKPVHGLFMHVQPHSEADAEPTSTSEERDATSEYEMVLFKDMTDDALKQHIADRKGRRAEVDGAIERLRAELSESDAELLGCVWSRMTTLGQFWIPTGLRSLLLALTSLLLCERKGPLPANLSILSVVF